MNAPVSLSAPTSRRWSFSFAPIRWKLFILISCAVALPVVILVVYFSTTERKMLSEMLSSKALALTHLLDDQLEPAIAFDDVQTARESFASAAADPDVTYLAIYRAGGTTLYSRGVDPDVAPLAASATTLQLEERPDDIRVVAPVVSSEGPRGTLVIGFSNARVLDASSQVGTVARDFGLGMLALGCAAAWIVGSSLARRIQKVKLRAEQVAAGDLSEAPLSDVSGDEIGQMARAFQVMVGVIERKVAERTTALAASREQFRYLLESTEAIPFQMDPIKHEIIYLGPQAVATFGALHERLLDPAYWHERLTLSDMSNASNVLWQTFVSGVDGQVEFTFRRDDGKEVALRSMMSVVGEGETRSIMGFMFDVTGQRQMEMDLRQAQKLESVGRLAAGVAHEINTPIQFVSDSVHFLGEAMNDLIPLLIRHQDQYPAMRACGLGAAVDEYESAASDADLDYLVDNVPKAIARSLEGLGRVATIVHAMKEFAHPEAREKASANVNAALAATLTIARNEYKFVADVATDFGEVPFLMCHIGELNQAFLNIIVNASHAIADRVHGTSERGLITIKTSLEQGDVVVRIRDTGNGIPEAIQQRIFDPFFTTKEVGRGTGQGLAIAHSVVVDKHAGRLGFVTELGAGTTFEIRLPLPQTDLGHPPALVALAA